MAKSVIIVESPAKSKTIKSFVGRGFDVVGSMGHVRDLPKSRLGVEVDDGFTPKYVIPTGKRKTVTALKKAVAGATTVYLATDPDREGESIAWHLAEALGLESPQRIEFNEITKKAVQRSLENPRQINMDRVNAQQARRVLDRLVGYKISPLLWKKVRRRNLSAGRVQSVAVRLVCDREREIAAFTAEEYWTITAEFIPDGERKPFKARLAKVDGEKANPKQQEQAEALVSGLKAVTEYRVDSVVQRDQSRKPPAPFITSTLQQEAARRLGFSARKTMSVAQQLYEGVTLGAQGSEGLITYMRTDSTRVADEARDETKQFISSEFGDEYLGGGIARSRGRHVQDAHEAVRPTSITRKPDDVRQFLTPDQFRLYQLVWHRFLASQMAPAIVARTTVTVVGGPYELRANGSRTKFSGFLSVWEESKKPTKDDATPGEPSESDETENNELPPLTEGESVDLTDVTPEQHFTQPPPRYSEASLVRALEAKGIGRPSTYAPILGTIVERQYVDLLARRFHATDLGLEVTDRLVAHFPNILDVDFTAHVEEDLDKVEGGEVDWVDLLREFYKPFEADLERAMTEMDEAQPKETDIPCPREGCDGKMIVRHSRYGEFLGCAKYPECAETMQMPATEAGAGTPPESAALPPTDSPCPKCGAPMEVRQGRFGPFYGCTKFRETGCKGIVNAPSATLCACPECGKGNIIEKHSRKDKVFFACDQYPDCKYALSNKPTGGTCRECGALTVEKHRRDGETYIACSRRECAGGKTREESAK